MRVNSDKHCSYVCIQSEVALLIICFPGITNKSHQSVHREKTICVVTKTFKNKTKKDNLFNNNNILINYYFYLEYWCFSIFDHP